MVGLHRWRSVVCGMGSGGRAGEQRDEGRPKGPHPASAPPPPLREGGIPYFVTLSSINNCWRRCACLSIRL